MKDTQGNDNCNYPTADERPAYARLLAVALAGRSSAPPSRLWQRKDAHSARMFARRPHIDGAIIVKTHTLLWCFSAHRAAWNVRQIGASPASALQIGSHSYAPLAADFLVMLMQEIGAFGAKSKIGLLGEKGRVFGGQD